MLAEMTATELLGAFQLGILTRNEVRIKFGYEPVEIKTDEVNE